MSDRQGGAHPAVTIVQRSPLARAGAVPTPGPRGAAPAPPAGPRAGAVGSRGARADSPNVAPTRKSSGKWKLGRVEIALAIAIVLIVILILTRT